MTDLTIVMPAYNEADGIADFLTDLDTRFEPEVRIIVVNDASTDDTAEVVEGLGLSRVELIDSPVNLGHGPTTIKALQAGVAAGTRMVMAVDGDGQFDVGDMHRLVDIALAAESDVVEGSRFERGDPLFRMLTSVATRVLVASRCGMWPKDANTPLRVYRADVLADLLGRIPQDAMTPNLFMSVLSRRRRLALIEIPVKCGVRRGVTIEGSTWGQRRRWLPTKRFLRFCTDAVGQWFGTRIR